MEKLRNALKYLLSAWYVALTVYCILVVIVALSSERTMENPTGNAGVHAAMMALGVGAIAFTRAVTNIQRSNPLDQALNFVMGLGLVIGAYFWISSEEGVHPTDQGLLAAFLSIWIMLMFIVLPAIPFISLIIQAWERYRQRRNNSED